MTLPGCQPVGRVQRKVDRGGHLPVTYDYGHLPARGHVSVAGQKEKRMENGAIPKISYAPFKFLSCWSSKRSISKGILLP